MRIKEFITLRLTVLSVLFVGGLASGIVYHFNKDKSYLNAPPIDVKEMLSASTSKIEINNIQFSNFEKGQPSTVLTAEKIIWNDGKHVQLIKPVLREYKEGTEIIIAEMSGDRVELVVDKNTQEMKSLNLQGNVRSKKFSKLEIEQQENANVDDR